MLNPRSPVPLYHQLADLLTEGIRSGEYRPGSRIPPEIGLAKHYGIGRPTARQAIDILVRKGMVERRRGSGTYVREPGQEIDLFSLAGTSSAFLRRGVTPETRILKPMTLQVMGNDVDNPFSGRRAFFFSRLTLARGEPVIIEDITLSPDLFPGMDALDLAGKSLAALVRERWFMTPSGCRQTFGIATLPLVRARSLGLGDRDPVLNVKRYIHFPQGDNAVYSEFFCRTDRFVFSQTLGGASHD
jgi:GntR family transcriptional regulator